MLGANVRSATGWPGLPGGKKSQQAEGNKALRPCHISWRENRTLEHLEWRTIPGSIKKESHMDHLDRITQQPDVMGGKACIRGTRVTVGMVVGQIGAGQSVDDVLADYPYLERDDIFQALHYAAWLAEEREDMLASA